MPTLDVSELNIVIAVLGQLQCEPCANIFTLTDFDKTGGYITLYGLFSVLIKSKALLGEALPAMCIGIVLGPLLANFLNHTRWGPGDLSEDQKSAITLGFMRVMISVQLLIAGYQLPAKYVAANWRSMAVLLLPIMTLMWLCTTACLLATVPKITLLAALAIGACVTSTDPVLSQAIAKGPFADMYVARPLREVISAEAGANDGFGFPFLMLATNLMRHTELPGVVTGGHGAEHKRALVGMAGEVVKRAGDVGRLDGGLGQAMIDWVVETWLYVVIMAVPYGALVGFSAGKAIKFFLKRRWIDSESYLLFPVALALFIIGTCGAIGTNDLLACFVAGVALNWDGEYLKETLERHDEVNGSIDVLLNFLGFMYVGVIMPWETFHDPDGTGITLPRLIGLGFLVLFFRRIPALMIMYKAMPSCIKSWKEAVFMGYFGPIGVGAVFYVEHTKHLFPPLATADAGEAALLRALVPSVYFLVLFSIVVHGLSIPALDALYRRYGVAPVADDAVQVHRKSVHVPAPANARPDSSDEGYFVAYNRFSRPAPNHRRTVLLDGRAVGQLPLVRDEDARALGTLGNKGSMDIDGDVDSIDEEKFQAKMRQASLQRLG
ncbi:uncharacterized protein PG986_004113 [Apiospora aurea]|uniref:Cation/H+ exchanger transmembrane domain-containing protein n=1 Tax=Apiospora aurea TaxID=335848 RepID=A0ABR1QN83_9PEZI